MAATLVIRLATLETAAPGGPVEAGALRLPEGASVTALGRAGAEILVVTEGPGGERLHVIDAATGETLSVTPIRRD